ncbi:anti-FecI sigma factor, FecR [Novosphingobium nitrogenifigens DSM 19370]|uniref:Anti-FecI sigma factor, FecR n=1 Tax=Novosphingobium nitrogenifigens DSM 19370 TaxID=983920 RepID=F1ZAI2_9SPHN|nr:FecR domain-containing protein [Novosphingobium nitrogenifigens]EGD58410.1 anti-FecI sigma factor, FecR [Novosphingobium nitrogenifigens DSM 19370]
MTGLDAIPEDIVDEAIAWHLASRSDAMDWGAFSAWLEASPLHRECYDQIAQVDAMVRRQDFVPIERHDAPAQASEPESVKERLHPGRKIALALAGAATLVASIAVVAWHPGLFGTAPHDERMVETGALTQEVVLGDGSRVMLAPHSRLAVGDGDRRMTVIGGAYFVVPHRPGRVLSIAAGGLVVSDIGTRFDIQTDGPQARYVRVAVAEGQVSVSGPTLDQALPMKAGRGLVFDAQAGEVRIAPVAPDRVGGWQDGTLTYADTPLALVAADLTRYAGRGLDVPDELKGRRFSGTLVFAKGHSSAQDLAGLMGLVLVHGADRDRLARPDDRP